MPYNVSCKTMQEVLLLKSSISDRARGFVKKKAEYFAKRGRYPKVVLSGRSCQGAVFRLFFSELEDGDTPLWEEEPKVYVQNKVLTEFGSFKLDLEHFFFAKRILIEPLRQSYECDCETKCH